MPRPGRGRAINNDHISAVMRTEQAVEGLLFCRLGDRAAPQLGKAVMHPVLQRRGASRRSNGLPIGIGMCSFLCVF
jgi:hypothetical protein